MIDRCHRIVRNTAIPFLLFAAATVWPLGSARAQACQTDVQCPGDLICDAGQCKAEGPAPPPTATAPPPTATALPPTAPPPTAPPPPTAVAPPTIPAPPADNTVPVQFTPRDGNPQITDVVTAAQCTAPCTLNLEPGLRKIRVGDVDAEPLDVNVPPGGTSLSVGVSSPTLQTTGLVLVIAGCGGLALGALIAIAGIASMPADEDKGEPGYSDDEDTALSFMAAGGVIAGVGLITALVGIIIQKSDDDGTIEQALDHPLVPRVGFAPLPGDGAFGAATWQF